MHSSAFTDMCTKTQKVRQKGASHKATRAASNLCRLWDVKRRRAVPITSALKRISFFHSLSVLRGRSVFLSVFHRRILASVSVDMTDTEPVQVHRFIFLWGIGFNVSSLMGFCVIHGENISTQLCEAGENRFYYPLKLETLNAMQKKWTIEQNEVI